MHPYRECRNPVRFGASFALVIVFALTSAPATAQLVPCDQVGINPDDVPGGCIARSLEDQIGQGRGDEFTPGSSVYLIKRDPARAIRRGRQLFQRKFTRDEGMGPRVDPSSIGDITEVRALGAGLADSCASCHGRPRGAAGYGGDVNTFPDSRDSPHLFGLGLVEQLADEMTMRLRATRQSAIDQAVAQGTPVTANLVAKKIDFGTITANPDGSVDTSGVIGVDEDLRIRPFFHQGGTASIREFVIGALNAEMGLQTVDPVLCAVTDPDTPTAMISPAGFYYDPAADTFERPRTCDEFADPDEDGIANELDPSVVDYVEFYLLNYFKPGQHRTDHLSAKGLKVMRQIGCTSCHVEELRIYSDRRIADVETVFDAENGIFNELFATAETRFTVIDDGEEYPQLLPTGDSFVVRNFFSDLKRHDLGPAFHERDFDGELITEHVTEPLWGVGSSPPYGHDGRSISLDAVIRRHGGEALESREAYEALEGMRAMAVISMLQSLVLFPPDDTASNLNPGDPGDPDNIQLPSVHGSINLGALFQIPEEGPE
jgi:hypothetical protein